MPTKEAKHRLPIFEQRFYELQGEMTQGEFAVFLGISRPTVGFYENGDRIPDALTLRQIAEKCNVPVDWLLGLTDNKSKGNVDIGTTLGLSDTAIEQIRTYYEAYSNSPFNMAFLNEFLGNNRFKELLLECSDVFTTYANLKALEDQAYLQRKANKKVEQERKEFGCITVEVKGYRECVKADEITDKDMENARSVKETDILNKAKKDYQFSIWQAQEIVKELMQDIAQKIYPTFLQKEGSKHGDDSEAGK